MPSTLAEWSRQLRRASLLQLSAVQRKGRAAETVAETEAQLQGDRGRHTALLHAELIIVLFLAQARPTDDYHMPSII